MEIRGNDGVRNAPQAKTGAQAANKGKEQPSYRQQLLDIMEKMEENIKKGTIQPKIPTGAQAYTVTEWKRLLEKFDAAEETIQEEVKIRVEKLQEEAEEAARKAEVLEEEAQEEYGEKTL